MIYSIYPRGAHYFSGSRESSSFLDSGLLKQGSGCRSKSRLLGFYWGAGDS